MAEEGSWLQDATAHWETGASPVARGAGSQVSRCGAHLSVHTRAMWSCPGSARKLLRLAARCPSSIAEWQGSTVRGRAAGPAAAAWRFRWFSTCMSA